MKTKILILFAVTVIFSLSIPIISLAATGDFGFFGGISEGTRLPKTTEEMLAQTSNKKNATVSLPYKELIFLDGKPQEFNGLLEIKSSGTIAADSDLGTYTVTYGVKNSDTTDTAAAAVSRTIAYTVNYRREGAQIIKDYSVRQWSESITLPGGAFTLDPRQSYSNISILEDTRPGVSYYSGSVSQRSVYTNGDQKVTLEVIGSLYGFNNPWSSAETHRLDCIITADNWEMQYQLRPSVTVNKSLQYTENEPRFISFPGNYIEVMQNKSGLQYDIFVMPQQFYDAEAHGGATLTAANNFEALTAKDMSAWEGHPAFEDIRKLFAMQILNGDPAEYVPGQAMTRGQYVTALTKSIKLPITPVQTSSRNKKVTPFIVFPDVTEDRPDYPYIIAAYKSGLAVGRENGHFYVDTPISRQEAITLMIRALGLEATAPNPTTSTPFVDNEDIASWAMREVYAAYRIGIISPDEDGKLNPRANLSKAEGAALINKLIDFMRYDLQNDYADMIVNFSG